jgi:hypothetical protein
MNEHEVNKLMPMPPAVARCSIEVIVVYQSVEASTVMVLAYLPE